MSIFEKQNIKSVKLLGIRTGKESGILANYNFSVYSFFVQYADDSSATIELSPDRRIADKKQFQELMTLANRQTNIPFSSTVNSQRPSSEVYHDLKAIKELLDSGVLSQDEYENQKSILLAELSGMTPQAAPKGNLHIVRRKPRPAGESRTIVCIDGIEHKEYDIDNELWLNLSLGTHTLVFRRVAIKSAPLRIAVIATKLCCVTFDPKFFSIEATCTLE